LKVNCFAPISENLASTVADGMKQRTAEEERIFYVRLPDF